MLVFPLLASMAVQATASQNVEPRQEAPAMKCETGPAIRQLGGHDWLVYSCEDRASMVVVSAPGNPAMPFYFFVRPTESGYSVNGEGSGDAGASEAAATHLSRMTIADFSALLAATRNVSR